MCGFAGLVAISSGVDYQVAEQSLRAMGDALEHRGPDGEGVWRENSVGIVHRRLAIQDLSPTGAQPMVSTSGRFVIAFNGEIYNFRVLRRELEQGGATFIGHSDTEVMLAAFEAWGLENSLKRFNGMFAFALVDRKQKMLTLARDRMGEKPLYYGLQDGLLLFGSELKALRAHPSFKGDIDRNALALYFRHNLIPAPHTIYQGVAKLPPATWVSFNLEGKEPHAWPAPQAYWSLTNCFLPTEGATLQSSADELEQLLSKVIDEQMISDVPLGAFLSGGIDSSTVVALMQKQSSQPVRTFSIGFNEPGFNEAEHARKVAAHLGTRHTELYVSAEDGLAVIPELPKIWDEPFADSSQIPTLMVSRMTREHVTVALSGDGGDELFCGYTRYPGTVQAWNRRNSFESRLRRMATVLPPELMARIIRFTVPAQRGRSATTLAERLRQEKQLANARSLAQYYQRKVSYWAEPESLVKGGHEPIYALSGEMPEEIRGDSLKCLMWKDLNWYLPDDILVKVDRAAMACSLETRVPMLDRRVVEFALGLPTALNVQGGVGKQVLRQVLYRHVPREWIERPKQGFAVPLGQWLRTSLREWAEDLLARDRLEREGYLHAAPVRRLWQAHLDGRDDHAFPLWGVLMFQAWLAETENSGHGKGNG